MTLMAKIRGREDLTAARDEVVARFEEFLTALRAASTFKQLDALRFTLKAQRADEALSDLVFALAEGGYGDDSDHNDSVVSQGPRPKTRARRGARAARPHVAEIENPGLGDEGLQQCDIGDGS